MIHTITIPDWHPTRLNALMSMHWAQAQKLKDSDTEMIGRYAQSLSVPKATGKRRVTIEAHGWPRGRMPDADSFWKTTLDALTRCGLILDDATSKCELAPVIFVRGKQKKTLITLEDLE